MTSTSNLANRKPHKFFDSFPQPAGRPPQPSIQHTLSPVSTPLISRTLSAAPQRSVPTPDRTPPASPQPNLPQASVVSGVEDGGLVSNGPTPLPPVPMLLNVPEQNAIRSAHWGYIYCMALIPDAEASKSLPISSGLPIPESGVRLEGKPIELVTGSGDEDVKVGYVYVYHVPGTN